MPKQLTANDFKQSLGTHVAAKGEEIRAKYGTEIGWRKLQEILQDRAVVRYPCEIAFDAQTLLDGEFAHPVMKGQNPNDGFTLYVHPFFMTQLDQIAYLVLYQLVVVNYGEFASPADAETFGANALGLSNEEYYSTLCELADQIEYGG